MPVGAPNFSPFPFARLPKVSRDEATILSALARHAGARSSGARLANLLGGRARITATRLATPSFDPQAALAEVRLGTQAIVVAASGGVRAIAQQLLGGPAELAAARPATMTEHAILALLVAAALEDAGIAGEVWPLSEHARTVHERELAQVARRAQLAIDQRDLIGRGGLADELRGANTGERRPIAGEIEVRSPTVAGSRRRAQTPPRGAPEAGDSSSAPAAAVPAASPARDTQHTDDSSGALAATVPRPDLAARSRSRPPADLPAVVGLELAIDAAGIPLTVIAWVPSAFVLAAPPMRAPHDWRFALPVVVARCALPREAVARLRPRDVIVVERELTLGIGDGYLGLAAEAGAVEARVTTGYGRRAMALPDDAHVELTVQLGAVRLSLRRLGELAVGEVIGLDRPLAGPYEIHAGGRVIGQGELVDLDGETGIRIVSLHQE